MERGKADETHAADDKSERWRSPDTPVKKKAKHLDRDMVAIWLFIGGLILISFLTAYQLWTKFSFRSP
jgi:hypothetical protein